MNSTTAQAIIQQLHNTHASNKPNTNVPTGSARLHLIIQFPVLNTSGRSDDDVTKRQTEYIYCLQRNLLNAHVSARHIHFNIIKGLYAEVAQGRSRNLALHILRTPNVFITR